MANPAEPISGQIYWPSPGSSTGHQRAHQLAAYGQKLMAIDTPAIAKGANTVLYLRVTLSSTAPVSVEGKSVSILIPLYARQKCGVPNGCA